MMGWWGQISADRHYIINALIDTLQNLHIFLKKIVATVILELYVKNCSIKIIFSTLPTVLERQRTLQKFSRLDDLLNLPISSGSPNISTFQTQTYCLRPNQ